MFCSGTGAHCKRFGTFRKDGAVDKVCTFTGEGTSEVEWLMCSAGMDDVGKNFRTGEITWFYSLRGCTHLHGNVSYEVVSQVSEQKLGGWRLPFLV